ncbi:hypothetical protein MAMC_00256 [Methylacidimicrobium cyclopophantes]|uniref:Radical SAM core domain-containing protein n=1 Tax=Methylacidimicrobium cyclopophantes TaxID=1041766 RepID=A0A5E6M921_9BACT|nr:radical SAM/SPASM domain-containing protein [Methylacidimicrobium cyclopophantes]VVM04882.1 hypothetical protein MAMC_00256 [Methylacidimicrobium cyclopophantes]
MSFSWKSVGLMITRRCPLACGHCVTRSSPRVQGKMAFEAAAGWIREIPRVSRKVCFTGGEPLLYPEEVRELTRLASQLGLSVSLVTGCGWAKNAERAQRILAELAEAGLSQIVISWDPFHEPFLKKDLPLSVARAAADCGLQPRIRSTYRASDSPDFRARFVSEFAPFVELFESQEVVAMGRARSLPPGAVSRTKELPGGFCPSVVLPVVDGDGRVYACCGPSLDAAPGSPLVLGNALEESLAEILERAHSDPLLHAIHAFGPRGLLSLLGAERVEEKEFSGICDLCLRLTDDPGWVARIRKRLAEPQIRFAIEALLLARKGERAQKPRPVSPSAIREREAGAALAG